MLIGFSKHTQGGEVAVSYLAGGAVNYMTGERNGHGGTRSCPPEILRGDPEITEQLIRLVPHAHKYTSGMIAFHPDDQPTETQVKYVMDEFERVAFAGMERGRDYDVLWVRHMDSGNHLHFVTPRFHLESGRYLNICPPGSRSTFSLLRGKLNLEHGWAAPDDPRRAQLVRLPHHVARLKAKERRERGTSREDIREIAANHVLAKARDGSVKTRDDAVRALRDAGLSVTRESARSITIAHPDTGAPVRLRGTLFDKDRFALGDRAQEPASHQRDEARLQRLSRQLEETRSRRERFNRDRYLRAEPQAIRSLPRIAGERMQEAIHGTNGDPVIAHARAWREQRACDQALIHRYATPAPTVAAARMRECGEEMEREMERL